MKLNRNSFSGFQDYRMNMIIKLCAKVTLHSGTHRAMASLVAVGLLLVSPMSMSQHEMHSMGGESNAMVTTMPADNSVLAAPPTSLMLKFESDVRLVNLSLRDPSKGKEIIDIGFRFSPGATIHFEQPLPALEEADYYVAEWSIINARGKLVKGVFNFSFGANAMPPSHYRQAMEHDMQIISPDYRLIR
jgi:methionine-rich copper-binding protein CopC